MAKCCVCEKSIPRGTGATQVRENRRAYRMCDTCKTELDAAVIIVRDSFNQRRPSRAELN